MNDYVIDKPARASVPVTGGGLFPVRRIYCVGQNYAKHIAEMGGSLNPEDRRPPFFFQKPSDAVFTGAKMPFPKITDNLHYEAELVLAIGKGGDDISEAEALSHVYGLAVGLDMTRRDRQAEMKAQGRSWEIAKAFDNAAPISVIVPVKDAHAALEDAHIALAVNGSIKQSAPLSEMIWSPAEIIAVLSTHYTLCPGDLIFTGTPEGVGPVGVSDIIEVSITGLPTLTLKIVPASFT